MIRIENVDIFGWGAAIRGARNPMNSWDKSDSKYWDDSKHPGHYLFSLGENDLQLLKKLATAGNDHGKFLRMINVTLDIEAPLYWWKEFDTYKVGTVANSCSTMHKIHAKEITPDDFSHEHLNKHSSNALQMLCDVLETNRKCFLALDGDEKKSAWWQLIQLLPSSYNQRRTVQLNYAVLRTMYHARKYHKLDEWKILCAEIENLPYAKELILLREIDDE